MNIVQACSVLKIEADNYREICDKLAEEKKTKTGEVKKTYLPNTPAYAKAMEDTEAGYYGQLLDAQDTFSRSASKIFEKMRDVEWKRVAKINQEKIAKIKAIESLPVTKQELDVLVDIFDSKADYWAEKQLQNIALKNGISIDAAPSFDQKMSVLNQLETQVSEIIRDYPSETDPETRMKVKFLYLNDDILRRAVKLYSGKDWLETAETKASQMYLEVLKKGSDMERGMALRNALENSGEDVRNLLLCRISASNDISDFAVEMSRHSGEIKAFRDGLAVEYLVARDAIAKIEKTDDEMVARRILRENADNRYMQGLLERARKNNDELDELLPDERNMTREQWIKSLQAEFLESATGGVVKPEDIKDCNA